MKAIMQGFVNKEKRFGFYRVQREAIPQDAFDRRIILPLGKDCGRQKWKQSLSFFFFFKACLRKPGDCQRRLRLER